MCPGLGVMVIGGSGYSSGMSITPSAGDDADGDGDDAVVALAVGFTALEQHDSNTSRHIAQASFIAISRPSKLGTSDSRIGTNQQHRPRRITVRVTSSHGRPVGDDPGWRRGETRQAGQPSTKTITPK